MSEHRDTSVAKDIARAHAHAARRELDDEHRLAAADAAASLFAALPELAAARMVLSYSATPEEIDPSPAAESLRARGIAIALPRIEEAGLLGIHLAEDEDALVTGMYGLREPAAEAPRVPLEVIDAVIVPGVAYDPLGRRLGHGGGYYDRLLPRLRPDCLRVGLAFDEQIAEKLPVADHDEHVDVVVTPTRVIRPPSL